MSKFLKRKMVDKFIAELSRGLQITYNTELIVECETQKQLRVSKWNKLSEEESKFHFVQLALTASKHGFSSWTIQKVIFVFVWKRLRRVCEGEILFFFKQMLNVSECFHSIQPQMCCRSWLSLLRFKGTVPVLYSCARGFCYF